MAISNPDTIEIRDVTAMDGRKSLKIKKLYIDGCYVASLEQQRSKDVKFRFQPVGLFNLQEAQVWLLGLLELSTHAEELKT